MARGWLARRRAKIERVVLFMRGRSGRFLLNLTFGAWSLPKKNRRRRLAATRLQRVFRGRRGRRRARWLRAERRQLETRVLEVFGAKPA